MNIYNQVRVETNELYFDAEYQYFRVSNRNQNVRGIKFNYHTSYFYNSSLVILNATQYEKFMFDLLSSHPRYMAILSFVNRNGLSVSQGWFLIGAILQSGYNEQVLSTTSGSTLDTISMVIPLHATIELNLQSGNLVATDLQNNSLQYLSAKFNEYWSLNFTKYVDVMGYDLISI